MKDNALGSLKVTLQCLLAVLSGSLSSGAAEGQNPEPPQRVAEIKEATVKNKQAYQHL